MRAYLEAIGDESSAHPPSEEETRGEASNPGPEKKKGGLKSCLKAVSKIGAGKDTAAPPSHADAFGNVEAVLLLNVRLQCIRPLEIVHDVFVSM